MMHGVLRSRLIEGQAAMRRLMEAMLKMIKFGIRALQEAYAGEST
jgi:hypothetical protein